MTMPDKKLKIGVGVSGGVDSMVLLHLLVSEGYDVLVINVEHGIRGKESESDTQFVREYCKTNKIECKTFSVDALNVAKQTGVSVELAARTLRYEIFEKLLKTSVDVIALAHHLDDQAETVLMRLLRGTGIRGIRGIVDREGYIHPLLDWSKEKITAYAKDNNIPYVQDSTNTDNAYTRNYIRNEIIPAVQRRYPEYRATIARLAENAAETEEYILTQIVKADYSQDNQKAKLPLSLYQEHSLVIKKSIVECLRHMGIEKNIESEHLNNLLALKNAQSNKRINLPFGIDAVKEYDTLTFEVRKESGSYEDEFSPDKKYIFEGVEYSFEETDSVTQGLSFDVGKIPEDAVVRTRKNGDVFRKFGGMKKSLSDYLTDIKLPAGKRKNLLLIAKDSVVYVVLGVEISDLVRIDSTTTKKYKVVIKELDK